MRATLEEVPLGGISLFCRGLTVCPLVGAGGCMLKLKGVLLTGLGNTACILEDLAPFEACSLSLEGMRESLFPKRGYKLSKQC